MSGGPTEKVNKMEMYNAQRILSTQCEAHSWRRGRDRGKRRLTYGIYGTEKQIHACFEKAGEFATRFHWNEFRNGKFMVW